MADLDTSTAAEVAAMQFAGGVPIAQLAEMWERDQAWVEEAIRRALLQYIPRRDGGLKATRVEMRAANAEAQAVARGAVQAQGELMLWTGS